WSIPLNHMPALGRASEAGLEWAASNREKAGSTTATESIGKSSQLSSQKAGKRTALSISTFAL
ncbi:MAG: hypothetical protein ABG776_20555, partial [Cyanobacteria bacterium J06555_13]